jgi:UDP-arabinose 4-epimerase
MNTLPSSRNVLVTGGAGYIGSHACKALAANGFTPICYDNLSRGHAWAVQWGPLEQGELLDQGRLEEVLRHYNPCAVMHFAALAYVGESVLEPALYYRNNVGGSLALLQSMQMAGIRNFIFSSTCATYGMPRRLPMTEDHPQDPINPYGTTKLMIEKMLGDFSMAYGLRSVSLRYFNAAGADPENEIGEAHDPETHLIPLALKAAGGDLPQLDIYGDDYDTADGTCIRDYIHVTDLADAHVKACQYLLDGGDTICLNLGNETGFSVHEIVKRVENITTKKINAKVCSRRPGDPACLVADSSKIKQVLKWGTSHSEIDTILSTAWNWYLKHRDRTAG